MAVGAWYMSSISGILHAEITDQLRNMLKQYTNEATHPFTNDTAENYPKSLVFSPLFEHSNIFNQEFTFALQPLCSFRFRNKGFRSRNSLYDSGHGRKDIYFFSHLMK